MDPRLQRRIQRYGWDRAADSYEASWRDQLEPAHMTMLALAEFAPGDRVIDVACGTGLLTCAAAAAVGASGTVVGVDLSGAMVEHARSRAAARGFRHARFERMDAGELLFAASSFDVSLCGLGLMYAADVRRAVDEMVRVLAPGGRAVAAVWGERRRCGWAGVFPIVGARVRTDVCPLFFSLGTGNRIVEVFERAGLTGVVAQRIETCLEWASAEEACEAAFASGPVALAHSRFDTRTRLEAEHEYLASIERWRNDSGYTVPGEFVIVAGCRSR